MRLFPMARIPSSFPSTTTTMSEQPCISRLAGSTKIMIIINLCTSFSDNPRQSTLLFCAWDLSTFFQQERSRKRDGRKVIAHTSRECWHPHSMNNNIFRRRCNFLSQFEGHAKCILSESKQDFREKSEVTYA